MPTIPSRVVGIIELDPACDQEDPWSQLVTGSRSSRPESGSSLRGAARGRRYSASSDERAANALVPQLASSARLARLQRELDRLHRSTEYRLRPRIR